MKKKLFGILFAFLALLLLIRAGAEALPDQEVSFVREVETGISPGQMARTFTRYRRWPEWHHNLERVTIEGQGPDAELAPSSRLRWEMQPKGKPWRKYELVLKVEELDPSSHLRLSLIKDSTGRLSELFEDIQWTLEYIPTPNGTRVTGRVRAKTRSWRSRLFSRMSSRILMNQLFYADLMRLAGIGSSGGIELGPRS